MLNSIIKPEFPVMDIEYDRSIIDLNESIEKTLSESASITVTTASDIMTASHYLKIYRHFTKKGEEIRKKCVEPFNNAVKDINGFFKKIYGLYSAEESRLEKELLNFNLRQAAEAERERGERLKALEEAAIQKAIIIEEEQKNGNANKNKTVEIPEIREPLPDVPKLSSANISGVSTARLKKWRVSDFSLIPREYLTVNEALVTHVRKGLAFEADSPIPGIQFYFETIIK